MLTFNSQVKSEVIDREMIDAARRALDKTWASWDRRYGDGEFTPLPVSVQVRQAAPAVTPVTAAGRRECVVCAASMHGRPANSTRCEPCQRGFAAGAQTRYRKTSGIRAARKQRENKL